MGVSRGSPGRRAPFLSHQRSTFVNKLLEKVAPVEVSHVKTSACSTGGSASRCRRERTKKGRQRFLASSWFFPTELTVERRRACFFWPPQKLGDTCHEGGLMSWMVDCHPRAEGAAAGLVLPHHGWGCLTAQKPTQHWLPANYRSEEAAACLFLRCRGIHLHFSSSS